MPNEQHVQKGSPYGQGLGRRVEIPGDRRICARVSQHRAGRAVFERLAAEAAVPDHNRVRPPPRFQPPQFGAPRACEIEPVNTHHGVVFPFHPSYRTEKLGEDATSRARPGRWVFHKRMA